MTEKKKLADLNEEELRALITTLQNNNAQLEQECTAIACQNSAELANKEHQININMDTIAKCMRILETLKPTNHRQC